ncbi:zinc finger protein OZF-like isoform X8 [Kryptolebias marmoratus]|uniref:zinc finger protein OZF-like isoform X8 n=1 Tax=Kryptolebias marmoratus TaxID=37003 RepID=UPI0007F8DF98|nr:zinc finger protein OZF-like isoform X8 [Kryptolebias marmoratus]
MSGFLEETGPGYEEERCRLKDKMQQNEIPNADLNPRVCLHRLVFPADVQQTVLIKEEAPEEWRPGVDVQDPETLIIKEEEEELRTSLDVEQLNVKVEADDTKFSFTTVPLGMFPADVQQTVLIKEEAPEEWRPGVDQQDIETLIIKDEEEELWTSLDVEQLNVKVEADDNFTEVPLKSEYDEEKPVFSQLHQHQVEDGDPPTSSSADQMKAAVDEEDCEVAETTWNIDKNTYEDDFSSSETEVSEDDDMNDPDPLLKNLSDSIASKKIQSEQKSFSCGVCGKTFNRKYRTTHMRIHSGQKPFVCDVCGHEFGQRSTLQTHLRIHSGQKLFPCDVCGHTFARKPYLIAHMRIHTGQKPFACDICGHRCGQKSNLNRHMRIHTGQKPFSCDVCGHKFGQKSTLNRHMRIHTGQKPFACDFCGQMFGLKSHLNSHTRIHTGQKPFACDVCGHRFREKSDLNRHIKIHTRGKNSLSLNNRIAPKDT